VIATALSSALLLGHPVPAAVRAVSKPTDFRTADRRRPVGQSHGHLQDAVFRRISEQPPDPPGDGPDRRLPWLGHADCVAGRARRILDLQDGHPLSEYAGTNYSPAASADRGGWPMTEKFEPSIAVVDVIATSRG
jgi:hypothetical protein